MKTLFIAIIFLTVIAIVIKLKSKSGEKVTRNDYFSKTPLTATEIRFYKILRMALPDLIILAQINLSSFIVPNKQANKSEKYALFNAISKQSVDFLICLPADMSIVAAIELDDRTHSNHDAKMRDMKKEKNLKSAGVELHRFHCEAMPSVDKIKKLFYGEHESLIKIIEARNGNQ